MKETIGKRALAILLSASMVFASVPLTAFAEEDGAVVVEDTVAVAVTDGDEAPVDEVEAPEADVIEMALPEVDLDEQTTSVSENVTTSEGVIAEEELETEEAVVDEALETEAEEVAVDELTEVESLDLAALLGEDDALGTEAVDSTTWEYGKWASGKFTRTNYKYSDGYYNYVDSYNFTTTSSVKFKMVFSTTCRASNINSVDFAEIYDVNTGATKWTTKGKLSSSGSASSYFTLPKGSYKILIGFSLYSSPSSYSDSIFGTYKFKLSPYIFKDVLYENWFYTTVGKAVSRGIMSGKSADYFKPNDKISRGEVATLLWNMAGKPKAKSGYKKFPDVSYSKYYGPAIKWASSVGIINGYSSGSKKGKFGPDDNVRRQDLAVMFAAYAEYWEGKSVTGSASNYSSMKDKAKVSSYARRQMGWCFKNKILTGTSDGYILPKNNATRAEAAKMAVVLYDIVY